MKKYLRYADVFVLFAGALGLLLRLIMRLGGTDHRGLYPANHPAWIILCLFSIAVVVLLWLLTRQVGADHRYHKNFPASTPGAIGTALAAVGIVITAINVFNGEILPSIVGILGLLSAAALLPAAWLRHLGKKPPFLCHALPAFFFALRIFLLGKDLGDEPEFSRFLFEVLASLAIVPACYQLWGFDVDLGKRDKSLFWSLTATYLCIVAIVGMENWLLYLTCGAWLLTNTCSLQYLPKKMRPAQQDPEDAENEPSDEAVAEAPAEPVSTAPVAETPADPIEEIDPEAILAEILRDIDKNVE